MTIIAESADTHSATAEKIISRHFIEAPIMMAMPVKYPWSESTSFDARIRLRLLADPIVPNSPSVPRDQEMASRGFATGNGAGNRCLPRSCQGPRRMVEGKNLSARSLVTGTVMGVGIN